MIFGKSATLGHDAFGAAAAVGGEIAQTGTHDPYISALRARDADAFDALVNRYSPEVFALLNRLTNDREEAADLTQETFLRALRSIADFRGESTLKTWLFRMARRVSGKRFPITRSRPKTRCFEGSGPRHWLELLPRLRLPIEK
jgi:hypothetical protein